MEACGGGRVRSHLARGVVGVLGQLGVHAVQADRVGDVAHGEAGLVQDGDDALVRLLHQVDDDLVVEVVDLDAKGGQGSSLTPTCRLVFNELVNHSPASCVGVHSLHEST